MLLSKWEKAKGKLYCDDITELYPCVEEAVNEYYEAYQGDFAKKKGFQVFYYSDKNGAIHNSDERKYSCYVLNKCYVPSKYDSEIVRAISFYKEGVSWKHEMPEQAAIPIVNLLLIQHRCNMAMWLIYQALKRTQTDMMCRKRAGNLTITYLRIFIKHKKRAQQG